MNSRSLLALSLAAGLTLCLLLLLIGAGSLVLADPGVQHVAPGGDCGGATPCYGSIQAAVNASSHGDLIKVAQGTYTDVHNAPSLGSSVFTATQVVVITTNLTLRGGFSVADWAEPDPVAHPTTLDAQGQGRVLCVIQGSPTIEGLQLTGGDASGLGGIWWGDVGGGVYMDLAGGIISDTLIFSNTAEGGGGVFVLNSSTTLRGCHVSGNAALGNVGGGLCLQSSSATLAGNTVSDNTTTT
jgi:parallel beta-helix repeat protein